jgi:hypothetical protein
MGVCVATAFAQQPMSSTTAQVTVVGMGSILGGDKASARDKAIEDAMRKAVEQAIGTTVTSNTLVQNAVLVEDNILSWSSGYVSNYKITREGAGPADSYEVEMLATVDTGSLRNDAAALADMIEKMGNPRMMLLVDEKNIGVSEKWYYFSVDVTACETAMIDVFRNKGFEVVDPATAKENAQREQVVAALEGNAQKAAALAKTQDAEWIITGKAIANVASGFNLGGMKSCQANITARLVRADDAKIIATASEHAAVPHIDEVTGGTQAIEKASRKCAENLLQKVMAEAQKSFYNQTTVNLRVEGFQSYNELQDFINKMKYYVRGIKSVNERGVSGAYANLDVKIVGNAGQLARELERKNIEPFTLKVTGSSMNRVDVAIKHEAETTP